MNPKLKNTLQWLIIPGTILLIYLLFLEFKRDKGLLPEQAKEMYDYKTDSLYKDKYYQLKKLYDKVTPPLIVEKWLPGEPGENKIDSIAFIPGEVLVYIQGLEKELKIKEGFLSKYPNARKLIEMKLQKDSLSITTMDINADIYTNKYPLALDYYKYQWYDNQLHNSPFENKSSSRKNPDFRYNGLFVNGGYDFTLKKPTTGLEYNLELGRFKLDAEFKSTFEKKPEFNAQAKIGYRLFK